MGLPLQNIPYYDNGGGLDLKLSPTKVPEDEASSCLNVDYSVDGAFLTRNGSKIMNVSGSPAIPAQMSGAPKTLLLYDYKKSDGTQTSIVCANTTIKHSLTSPANVVTGISGLLPYPDIEFFVTSDDEYCVWGNGADSNLKYNGTVWTNLSLPRPAAPVAADAGVGTLPAGAYTYYYSFARTVGGIIVQESELSPAGSVTIAASRQIQVTVATCSETLLTGVTAQCNARVIYRVSPTSGAVAYRLATIADNTTTTYTDNTAADGTIEAEFDNQAPPKSKVFEENYGKLVFADADNPTDYLVSKASRPWNVPEDSRVILDGKITCIKRVFGVLIIGTDKSIWVLNGDPATAEPRRVSSAVGILNNRCAVAQDTGTLYVLTSNKKFYSLTATDFSQNEIRFSDPLSLKIDPLFLQITTIDPEVPCIESYTTPNVAKVVLSVPIGNLTNNRLIIYNESQSLLKGKPVWQVWNNIYASALRMFSFSGILNLYSGDYNGFIWKLDDSSLRGDGAEENGTATSSTTTTITDTTKTWVVNSFVGMQVKVLSGVANGQTATITSNTSTQLTFTPALTSSPGTATYTVGGYDVYHYSNWKYVLESYDALKQLWFVWINANASGNYPISLILQYDFDQTEINQIEIPVVLSSSNAIWGSFIWGAAIWGAQSVFQDRFRQFLKFRAIRVGFLNRKAGQPFQINGFSISAQNQGLFFRSR